MKLKAGEIAGAFGAVGVLQKEKLPVGAKYFLARLSAKLRPEVVLFEEQRNVLLAKHGKPVEGKSGTFMLEGDGRKVFTEELKAISDTEVEVDAPSAKMDVFNSVQIDASLEPLLPFLTD